ncbi:MAG: S8 family serine peptidase [Lachnospiraceae bacterium]|nr:S8 family serine peptidase [Lachnospiraceae bacterium]
MGVSAAKYNATSKIYEPNAKNTYNSQIELCSPGSTTSAATPFAAGCAALLMEAKPGMTAAQCRKLLDDTALDVGNAGKDMYSGYGLIQPAAALKKINPSFQWTIGDLSKASLSVKTASYVYDGKAKKPVVTVKYGSDTLKEGTDYTLTYANNKTVGQATATVSGKGAYTGSKSTDFKILPAKSAVKSLAVESTGIRISWKKVAGAGEYRVYRDGKKIYTTSSASYLDKGARTNGKNYRYQVIAAKKINGQDYAGAISDSKSARFLSAPTIKTITNPKSRQMVVTWNKNASSGGYRLEYSLYSSFKNAKKVTVRGASTVSKRITGLQKNRTYYVRICAYRSLDESAWSKVKKLKVR